METIVRAPSFNFPQKIATVITRIKANAVYFHTNHTIFVLFSVFLSLVWNPLSLLILLVIIGAWLFLYFLRDEPLTVFDREIDHRACRPYFHVYSHSLDPFLYRCKAQYYGGRRVRCGGCIVPRSC
ncbi:hypothetical protein Rs2_29177 [Raphanus sativus]|nr:hypothetical protein Rs2_29177 [Raphanus sativus]